MKSTFISTRSMTEATRLSIVKIQSKLVDAQKELSSGRLADVGQSLGYRTGQTVSLRQEHTRLTAIIDANANVTARLDMTQASLKYMVDSAQDFIGQLIGARNSDTGPSVIQSQAEHGLKGLLDALSNAFDGAYLFSGINADVKPIAPYHQLPPGLAQQAVANAFTTAFGVPQSDPATQLILTADMQTFLDGPFAALFDTPSWSANWSMASDQNVRSRISTYELVESGVNANDEAFRQLAAAFTMVADLGVEALNQGTFQTVVDAAIGMAGEAVKGLSGLQSSIGTVQERVERANERMSIQIDLLSTHIGALEAVNPYEASTRVSTLMTQIETAYALTARLQQMSLMNYL